jgi:hypothetical protein
MAEGNGNNGHAASLPSADRYNRQMAEGNGNNGHVATPAVRHNRQMAKHPFAEEDDSALFANNPVSHVDDKPVFHFLNTDYGRWANNPVLEDVGNSQSAKPFASEADNWLSANNPLPEEETNRRSENGEWLSVTCSGGEVDNGQAANFPASHVNDAKYTGPEMETRGRNAHSPALYNEGDIGKKERTTLRLGRSKRNPGCMRQCLLLRLLHPSQCHFIC